VTDLLTQRSLSLFAAMGGWRTVVEAVASRLLFLVVYLLTGQVLTSALVAVGGVLVFAVLRVYTDRKWLQAGAALAVVGISALLAGSTGRGVDFYLLDVLRTLGGGLVVLVSMLVGWPVVGVVVGVIRGERFAWRREPARRRRYQLCTAVFLAKYVVVGAVLVPLYLAGQVVALGLTATVLNTLTLGGCVYLCWRILREDQPGLVVLGGPLRAATAFPAPLQVAQAGGVEPLLAGSGVPGPRADLEPPGGEPGLRDVDPDV
jgi:hypothetical protein